MGEYLTLASDASAALFPDNRIGSFRCKLPKSLHLKRERHQIGLSYISWPHKLANIEEGHFRIRATFPDEDQASRPKSTLSPGLAPRGIQETIGKKIAPGHYRDVPEVLAALNDKIRACRFRAPALKNVSLATGAAQFEYDHTSERVIFAVKDALPCELKISLSWELHAKLGYSLGRHEPTWVRAGQIGDHIVNLFSGKNALFVYSNVVSGQRIVGNVLAALLRIVPFHGEHNSVVQWEPQKIEYCDLAYDDIDEIKIDILDDTGQIFKFLSGKVFITLHIKDKFE